MYIDILVGVFAGLIIVGLLVYFILSNKKGKRCNCTAMKSYKKSLKKAQKEIQKAHK